MVKSLLDIRKKYYRKKILTHSFVCNPQREHVFRYFSIFGNELRVIYHHFPIQKVGDLENSIGILTRVEVVALTWRRLYRQLTLRLPSAIISLAWRRNRNAPNSEKIGKLLPTEGICRSYRYSTRSGRHLNNRILQPNFTWYDWEYRYVTPIRHRRVAPNTKETSLLNKKYIAQALQIPSLLERWGEFKAVFNPRSYTYAV